MIVSMRKVVQNQLALIFDMDGVIIDSTSTHTRAWEEYLKRQGVETPRIEDRMLGKRNDEILRDFLSDRQLTDDEIFQHGAAKEKIYREIIGPELNERTVPGVAEFLQRNQHLPIGLATNAEPANVDLILDGAGIRRYFRAVVNGHDVKRPKPYPDIYLRVAELLQTQPENCVVFEDSRTGVQAARAAGMHVVGLTTTLADLTDVDLSIRSFLDPGIEPWLQTMGTAF